MTGYDTGAAYPTPAQYYPGMILLIFTLILVIMNHDDFAGPGPEAGDPRAHQGPGQWGYPGGGHGGQVPGQGSPSDRYSYYDNRWL